MRRGRLSSWVICAGLIGIAAPAASGPALAQNWTAIRLDEDVMSHSYAYAADGQLISGYASIDGVGRPILWNTAAETWSDLTPSGFSGGHIRAAFGGRQGGTIGTGQTAHAALWSGTVESFVDLHPAGNPYISEIQGMSALEQVGYFRPILTSPAHRAALWRGTAASFVSLHPTGTYDSEAPAVADGRQGGFFRQTEASAYHAVIWSGTAQSMIDLHPGGAIESQIFGVAPGQQVGWSRAPVTRAAMWHGTAQSYIDMGPPGSGVSLINATCGSAQAGYANFAGDVAAVVWFGSPTNFVRLDAFLPPGAGQSTATGISEVNGVFYISGYARIPGGGDQAYVWIGVPAPGTLAAFVGAAVVSIRRRREPRR